MIKRVAFQGVKVLFDVVVELERFTVLVGPNGCGKTTLLDQIGWISGASAGQPGKQFLFGNIGQVVEATGVDALRTLGRDADITMRVEDDAGRLLTLNIPRGPHQSWASRALVHIKGVGDESVSLTLATDQPTRERYDTLVSSFPWASQRLALVPSELRRASPASSSGLTRTGFGLPTALKDLAGNDGAAFTRLKDDLMHVVPVFRDLRFAKTKVKSTDETHHTLEFVMQQGHMTAAQVSDGTMVALGLLTATHSGDLPALVLIDDLDHGLHLSAQFEVVQAIRRVLHIRPALQVVCTAHSPTIVDAFEPAEVRVMSLDADGYAVVGKLTDHPKFARLGGVLRPGEFWASTGEEWLNDAVGG